MFSVSEIRILFLGQTLMHNPQPLQRSLLISMRPFKIFSLSFRGPSRVSRDCRSASYQKLMNKNNGSSAGCQIKIKTVHRRERGEILSSGKAGRARQNPRSTPMFIKGGVERFAMGRPTIKLVRFCVLCAEFFSPQLVSQDQLLLLFS